MAPNPTRPLRPKPIDSLSSPLNDCHPRRYCHHTLTPATISPQPRTFIFFALPPTTFPFPFQCTLPVLQFTHSDKTPILIHFSPSPSHFYSGSRPPLLFLPLLITTSPLVAAFTLLIKASLAASKPISAASSPLLCFPCRRFLAHLPATCRKFRWERFHCGFHLLILTCQMQVAEIFLVLFQVICCCESRINFWSFYFLSLKKPFSCFKLYAAVSLE